MISETKRLKEIVKVLEKHHLLKDRSPKNIREMFEDLGPTFVKMGQILASRSDIIPKEYAEEFKKLRSSVKTMDYEIVEKILKKQYGENLDNYFKKIYQKSLGSASIAETHLAILNNGEKVVLKIQRENIYEMMSMDSKLIKRAINILCLDKIFSNIVDLNSVIDEMYTAACEEMDFIIEANHMEEFANNNVDIKYIKPIKVYKEYSSKNILVMEYIGGYNIDNKNQLIADGYDLNEIAKKLSQNYIKQAIDDGFFHADPHPDNIKIDDGKIVFLDFGMMGRLSGREKGLLNKCIEAIVRNDIREVAHVLVMLDTEKNSIDYMKLENDIKTILDQNRAADIVNIDVKQFIADMYELLNSNSITLPKNVTMLIRGIVIISGLLEDLSPSISLIEVLGNYFNVNDIITEKNIKSALVDTARSSLDLVKIPSEMLKTFEGINSGELKVKMEMNHSMNQTNNVDRLFNQAIIGFLDVSLIVGMSIMALKSDKLPPLFYVYVVLSCIFTFWLFAKIIKNRITRKK